MPLHGGIDADVMGLGKTLTMLSAIVCTLRGATDFVDSSNEVEKPLKSRATLVVVSSHRESHVVDFTVGANNWK